MTYEHWSRYVVMSFCFAVAIILSVTRVIDYVLNLVASRLEYLKTQRLESPMALHATSGENPHA